MEFMPGEKVALKQGGPSMLVTNNNQDGTVVCFWFCETRDKLVWQSFPCEVLRPALSM